MPDAKKGLEEYGIYFNLKKNFAPQSTSPFQLKFLAMSLAKRKDRACVWAQSLGSCTQF